MTDNCKSRAGLNRNSAQMVRVGECIKTRLNFNTYLSRIASESWRELCVNNGALRLNAKGEEFVSIGNYNLSEIQELIPMHRGKVGVANLNTALEASLNSDSLSRVGNIYRQGDIVMYISNHCDKNVFNGGFGYSSAVVSARNTKLRERLK